jgi:hypothetical protein
MYLYIYAHTFHSFPLRYHSKINHSKLLLKKRLTMSTTEKEEKINDIEMEHFGCSNDWLSTTGVNTCVGFIVFLNNGENVLIEHWSDISFPETLNINNVRSCFKKIARHIDKLFEHSNVT